MQAGRTAEHVGRQVRESRQGISGIHAFRAEQAGRHSGQSSAGRQAGQSRHLGKQARQVTQADRRRRASRQERVGRQ
jgi:hypothetical protein